MRTAESLPHIPELPLIGSFFAFRDQRLDLLLRVGATCGDIGRFSIGPLPIVFLNAADLIHDLLVTHGYDTVKLPDFTDSARPVLGNGLLTNEGTPHKAARKLVAPAFAPRTIAGYATTMASYAERLQSEWTDGATIDIHHEMTRLTLWIVGKTLFDADVLDEADDLGHALTTAIAHVNAHIGALVHLPQSWPTPQQRHFRAAIARLDATMTRIIAEHRHETTPHADMLAGLLAARDEDGVALTDAQIRDEVMTLFLAGHETTANAMSWTWHLLAHHPAAYDHLLAEIDAVLGGRSPTLEDLPMLPYALQICKESLRLYPPAYFTGRKTLCDITLGDYALPRGTLVMLSPYTLHRRADYFADPLRFLPERFSPEREAAMQRHAYMPFGGGPRVCIGNHFAMMEMQIMLVTLAQQVTFAATPGEIVAEPLVTLRPKGGITMTVRRRALHTDNIAALTAQAV